MTKQSLCEKETGIDPIVKSYFLIVRAPRISNKSSGGIILPDNFTKNFETKCNLGKVLKVGPTAFQKNEDSDTTPYQVKEGDWIYYLKFERADVYIANPADINGHQLYFINDNRIFAVLKQEDLPKVLGHFYESEMEASR